MKKLLLFDVDGTIAEAGQKINEELAQALRKIRQTGHYDMGIVGGGTFEKIQKQINGFDSFDHIFTECGCVYHRKQADIEHDYTLVAQKNLRHHPLYLSINRLV